MLVCQGVDNRAIGTWLLVAECDCYTLGGDLKWKKASRYRTITFDTLCKATIVDSAAAHCNSGVASFSQTTLNLILLCSDCSTSPNEYEFEFDSDTLILKGLVEEGYSGAKYVKE
jgi:hypothetical protein